MNVSSFAKYNSVRRCEITKSQNVKRQSIKMPFADKGKRGGDNE